MPDAVGIKLSHQQQIRAIALALSVKCSDPQTNIDERTVLERADRFANYIDKRRFND
jgi:hypothetical protein